MSGLTVEANRRSREVRTARREWHVALKDGTTTLAMLLSERPGCCARLALWQVVALAPGWTREGIARLNARAVTDGVNLADLLGTAPSSVITWLINATRLNSWATKTSASTAPDASTQTMAAPTGVSAAHRHATRAPGAPADKFGSADTDLCRGLETVNGHAPPLSLPAGERVDAAPFVAWLKARQAGLVRRNLAASPNVLAASTGLGERRLRNLMAGETRTIPSVDVDAALLRDGTCRYQDLYPADAKSA